MDHDVGDISRRLPTGTLENRGDDEERRVAVGDEVSERMNWREEFGEEDELRISIQYSALCLHTVED